MSSGRANWRAVAAGLAAALASVFSFVASAVHAGDAEGGNSRSWQIDTEHLFGFVIGTDVGNVGDKEMEAETVGGFGKRTGSYAMLVPSIEYEFVPVENLRLAPTILSSYHAISGVADLDDQRQFAFDGLSFDVRHRIIDRSRWGTGLTINVEPHWGLVDETSGQRVQRYGADFAVALDRELVPDRVVAALNLIYKPEVLRMSASGMWARETTVGMSAGVMVQVFPGILIGGEGRYLQKYEGINFDNVTGRGLLVGTDSIREAEWAILDDRGLERRGRRSRFRKSRLIGSYEFHALSSQDPVWPRILKKVRSRGLGEGQKPGRTGCDEGHRVGRTC